MTTTSLVTDLEPLTHRQRMHRLVLLGRDAASGDTNAKVAIETLAASDNAYERLLALISVYGSREGARVLVSLVDPSRTVRRTAGKLLSLACDDAQASAGLASIVGRRPLRLAIAHLVRRGRTAAVDAFLEARMRDAPEPAIVDLLPMGSGALVARFMSKLDQGGGEACWERLVARHPTVAAQWFEGALVAAATLDARLRYRLLGRLPGLAERAPDATLSLVRALFERGEEPISLAATLVVLVRHRPAAVFDLVRARHESARPTPAPGAFGVVRFSKVAPKLGAERLRYLLRHAWATLDDGKRGPRWFLRLDDEDKRVVLHTFLREGRGGWGGFLFRYLRAVDKDEIALREEAFERWSHAAQASDGTIGVDVLSHLPRDLREREARRHLEACPSLASKPERKMAYARLLPFTEAKQVLAPLIGHPEGEERAKAQRVLLATLELDRGAMAEGLASVKARKFEQDPVRLAMFDTLANLPIARFAAEHLEAVAEVVQDALDAADLSSATSASVERLVVRLFRLDGAWGARWLAKLFAIRGSVSAWGLGDGLTRAEAEALSPALEQLADAWATRERAVAIVALAQSLGRRLAVVLPLQTALERLTRELPFVGVAAAALDLLRKHDRARFTRLAVELLETDKSFALIPSVARLVSVHRQDLLPDLLRGEPMTGRFASGRTHWILDFDAGLGRWTSDQQRTYARSLGKLLADPERDVPTLRFAIARLVRLAFADAAAIVPFAADPRPPLREMAIRGLPWLDAAQGVPTLVEALGDDRARWAIYALRKVFSEMRRDEVLAALRAVPTKKVTVAKEVVRLLGEMGGSEALDELLRLDRPDTHRDVRIALLRALWDHLEAPRVWDVLTRAVADPDWIVASKLADIPLARLSDDAEARVASLLGDVLGRREPEARLDLLRRAAYLPLRDRNRVLFGKLLAHLATPAVDEATLALAATLQRMQASEVAQVAARLRDLVPNRRTIPAMVSALAARLGPYSSSPHLQVAEDLLLALRGDEAATSLYLQLGARVWAYPKVAAALSDLSARDLLHFDAMEAALAAVRASPHPDLLEASLTSHSDPRVRRLGLAALVHAAGPKEGWTKDRRSRLSRYQRDPSIAVSGPASFVFPPE